MDKEKKLKESILSDVTNQSLFSKKKDGESLFSKKKDGGSPVEKKRSFIKKLSINIREMLNRNDLKSIIPFSLNFQNKRFPFYDKVPINPVFIWLGFFKKSVKTSPLSKEKPKTQPTKIKRYA